MKRQFLVATAIVVSVLTSTAAQEKPAQDKPAQDKPALAQPPPSAFTGPRIPLRVQFVLSRYLGEKKISSMPYVLGVLSNGQKTSLRMGIQVPVVMTTFKGADNATIPSSSYSYRDVGTNIDCQAGDAGSGQYNLIITIQDSSIHLDASQGGASKQQVVRDVPAFRSFHASFAMLLREGQTMQYASATDPITGEVVRVDVTLSLAK
jgi:hypothetical protein